MRLLLVLTSVMFVGCAHESNFQVVGSVYCETERPEGKAVAKVEFRYTPCIARQDSTRQAAGANETEANIAKPQVKAPPGECSPIAQVADQVQTIGCLHASSKNVEHECVPSEPKLLNLCQSLLDK